MATTIQVKRGLAAAVDAITPVSGEPVWTTDNKQLRIGDGSTAGGNKVAMESVLITRTFLSNCFICPAPGTDWTPQLEGVGLVQSKSAKKCWLPLGFLKIGDKIVSYKIVGDAVEADALTLDCKLVRVNKADPLTTTDVTGGGITQVDADGNFDSEATLSSPETVATDKQYALEILGTTGTGDSITVIGAEVVVQRLP
jgi:hypothetical protein